MVEDGVMTEEQADAYREVMKHLTGLQTEDLLTLIAASRPTGNTYATGNTEVSNGANVSVDTTAGPVTITLPSSAQLGARVDLYDAQNKWATNNVTVDGNVDADGVDQKINGSTSNLVLNTAGAHVTLIFNGGATGWKSYL